MKKFWLGLITGLFLLFSTAIQAAQVTLAWDPNDPTPDGYRLFQRIAGNGYNYSMPVYAGDYTATQATVANLDVGATYYFVARAYTGENESGDSNEVQYTPADGTLTKVLQLTFSTNWLKRNVIEYYGTTDQILGCSWPPVAYAEGYEVVLYSVERDHDVAMGRTSNTNITFTLPRTGHYTVKVRACKSDYSECTGWSASDNAEEAVVDGAAKGWIIYGTIKSPGPITIE